MKRKFAMIIGAVIDMCIVITIFCFPKAAHILGLLAILYGIVYSVMYIMYVVNKPFFKKIHEFKSEGNSSIVTLLPDLVDIFGDANIRNFVLRVVPLLIVGILAYSGICHDIMEWYIAN